MLLMTHKWQFDAVYAWFGETSAVTQLGWSLTPNRRVLPPVIDCRAAGDRPSGHAIPHMNR